MLDKSHVSPGAATFVVSMLKIILYLTLILGIAMQFGLKESSVAALVASGGVAIGLALQGGLSNLAGGFLILLFQPFQIGDYILTQGQEGTVQKIEILYTTLHTIDNRKVIVPNGNLANNVIVNVTAADRASWRSQSAFPTRTRSRRRRQSCSGSLRSIRWCCTIRRHRYLSQSWERAVSCLAFAAG